MPSLPTQPALVLVVEDNEDAQVITTSMLRHAGYEVMNADNLADAHQLALSRRPDAVILDCRLPDGDGLSLAHKWKLDPGLKNVPVIVLSAFSARQDMEAALLAGADAFLVKPCQGAALAEQVEKVLGGRARPSHTLKVHRPV